jgi:hypothetical protein
MIFVYTFSSQNMLLLPVMSHFGVAWSEQVEFHEHFDGKACRSSDVLPVYRMPDNARIPWPANLPTLSIGTATEEVQFAYHCCRQSTCSNSWVAFPFSCALTSATPLLATVPTAVDTRRVP